MTHEHGAGWCAFGAGPCQHERDCPHHETTDGQPCRFPEFGACRCIGPHRSAQTFEGLPHDYGEPCCCEACTGPEGQACEPDVWGARCVRCGREATRDDREMTARIFEGIAATIAATLPGQLSWLA